LVLTLLALDVNWDRGRVPINNSPLVAVRNSSHNALNLVQINHLNGAVIILEVAQPEGMFHLPSQVELADNSKDDCGRFNSMLGDWRYIHNQKLKDSSKKVVHFHVRCPCFDMGILVNFQLILQENSQGSPSGMHRKHSLGRKMCHDDLLQAS